MKVTSYQYDPKPMIFFFLQTGQRCLERLFQKQLMMYRWVPPYSLGSTGLYSWQVTSSSLLPDGFFLCKTNWEDEKGSTIWRK